MVHTECEQERFQDEWIAPMGVSEMAATAERFFETQQDFKNRKLPSKLSIGFHYTASENIRDIVRFGLLSRSDRSATGVHSKFNGDNVGDGIYVASDPMSFKSFGGVGILAACIRGREGTVNRRSNCDSVVVRPGAPREFHVLATSQQCLPLLRFSSSMIDLRHCEHNGNELIEHYTKELQNVLDSFCQCDSPVGSIIFDNFIR